MAFDLNHYKDRAAQKLSLILDRPVTIESMHTKLALVPTITITGFKIANNDPFANKDPLLFIQKMDAELELAPLLNSQINIHKVNMDTAEIHLFENKNEKNWVLSASKEANNTSSKNAKTGAKLDLQKNLRLDVVTIGNLNVSHDNSIAKHTITANKLEMKNFHMFSGEILYKKQSFSFTLNMGNIFDILNQKPNFPVDLKIQSRLINASLNGKIGNFKNLADLQATLSARTNNIKNLFTFFEIKNPLIPTQNGQLQLQVTGDMKKMNVKQANFNINSEKDLKFSSSGTLTDVLTNPELNLNLTAQLVENKLTELWRVQPMSLSGDVTITKTGLKAKSITIDANRSDARIAVDMGLKNKKYNISAALVSNFLNIYDFIKKTVQQNKCYKRCNTSFTKQCRFTITLGCPTKSQLKS